MPNRLAAEQSPYLRQHAENPVDWLPWGEEALGRARSEDRPILVSIGYSACHWCHVMAHESFEDQDTAALMNDLFVNIKVDREERPDVDAIYMEAVQALTGQGGWPLNVFLTPSGEPFFGGTYFPPVRRHGMPSWAEVLRSVAAAYHDRPDDVRHNAAVLTQSIRAAQQIGSGPGDLVPDLLDQAYRQTKRQFDWREGGFGPAPKFPQPLGVDFVLRMYRRTGDGEALRFVLLTLERMRRGGIYDQLGGGFHRYSVDDHWLVPHFEKMLYDNALLAHVYLHAWQLTGEQWCAETVRGTLDYLLRDLCSPAGAFFSAQDADSEGVEGKYYVWTLDEFRAVLGSGADLAAAHFGVTANGNFEGANILTLAKTAAELAADSGSTPETIEGRLKRSRQDLLSARGRRIPPGTDDKILAGWNGMAIRALAEAGRALGHEPYVEAAGRAARWIMTALRPGGRLKRSYRDAPTQVDAFLEDYASLAEGLLTLYEVSGDLTYFRWTRELVEEAINHFHDPATGAFYDAAEGDDLIARPRSLFDNPIPSGNSALASVLLRLAGLMGEARYERLAEPILHSARDLYVRAPLAVSYLLGDLDRYLAGPLQVAIAGTPDPDRDSLLTTVYETYLPNAVVAAGDGDEPALLAGRESIHGRPTAYVCRQFACRLPVATPSDLRSQLEDAPDT